MQIKGIYIILATFLLLLSPLSSYSYYDENFSTNQAEAPDDAPGYSSYQMEANDSDYSSTQDQDDDYHPLFTRHRTYSSHPRRSYEESSRRTDRSSSYYSRLPQHISAPGERVIIVDPRVHAFGAYSPDGTLVKAGIATAGSGWCRDLHRSCRTKVGTFRIYSLGSSGCVSSKFPLGRGGAPMPYCMYFNGSQGLHGSYETADANLSHGCVRLHVSDAEWIRFNFARIGTKVIIKPY